MKKLILATMGLIAIMILSQNSSAKGLTESKILACDIPYDLVGTKQLRSFDINTDTRLTPTQMAQVKAAAARWAVQADYDEYLSFKHSIEVMKNDSEAGDLYYNVFRYKGEVYTEVVLYPGGNAFGVIFHGDKLIAEQHDGDIVCERYDRN